MAGKIPETALTSINASMDDQAKRRLNELVEALVALSPSGSSDDLRLLCSAWHDYSATEKTGLWLYNAHTGQWQLISTNSTFENLQFPNALYTGRENLLDFSSRNGKPAYLVDFKVVTELDRKTGARPALFCVPFQIPIAPKLHTQLPKSDHDYLLGAVVLELSIEQSPVPTCHHILPARITGVAVANALRAEQQNLLLKLNSLAAQYLTAARKSPSESRSKYLEELICLFRKTLKYSSISIFYRDESQDKVICLATSGLSPSKGVDSALTDLSVIQYCLGEAPVGECFSSGIPIISSWTGGKGAHLLSNPLPQDQLDYSVPWAVYPISLPGSVAEGKPTIVGVMHITANPFLHKPLPSRHFDPIAVETLDLIASQIAPVLETMDTSIRRERQISIIKHDLFAPVRMIQDMVDDVTFAVGKGHSIGEHDLENIGMAALKIRNLAEQLAVDPLEVKAFDPIPTYLEGDIVARLCKMLRHYARVENGMSIFFSGFVSIPRLNVDPTLIERALSNLIINAVKYGKRGTTIYVEAHRSASGFHVTVSNHGVGILQDETEKIFSYSFRGSNVRHRLGTGLGLKVARAIMERHKGRLTLLSRRDPTVFSMDFPRNIEIK